MEYLIKDNNIELFIETQKRDVCEDIVDKLYLKRIELGMTQQDISDITGIKRPNVARIESCIATPTMDVLVRYAAALGYKINITLEEDEIQREGRNKETLVDSAYISGGEYKRKIDMITNSSDMNRIIYQKAKEMLEHRSGTPFEDMYWFDMESKEIICSKLDELNRLEVRHTKAIEKKLKNCNNILAVHTHPHSMPPSVEDFNCFVKSGYKMGIVLCHDGTIYRYFAFKEIDKILMEGYLRKFYDETHDVKMAQIEALNIFMNMGEIFYEEVKL